MASKPEGQIELQERLRFETLISDVFARFVSVPAANVDREIEDAQRSICECLRIDHSALWQANIEDPNALLLTHLYRNPELPPAPDRMNGAEFFPWMLLKITAKEIVCFQRVSDLPAAAARDQETCRSYGIKSAVGFPLSTGGSPVFGVLSFDATKEERDWPEPLQERLQLIAQVFANALERKNAEQKLRESEARLSLAAASADAGLWTLDPDTGHIWATDKTYEVLGLPPAAAFDLEKFLAVVHPEDHETILRDIRDAIQSGNESSTEYRVVLADGGVRWIAARGRRQGGEHDQPIRLMGVIIDITKSKVLEKELKALRDRLQAETDYLREEVRVSGNFDEIIGQSKPLKKVFQRIEQVAPTDSVVLVTGETGTGKELVARAIHNLSRRKDRLVVRVDCASLPSSLIENELFGREKGAYTGALTKQMGRFELADNSTLFLDEIGELSLELQAKLLRVVQDGQFERLGGPKTIKVNVRIIAATHRDLGAKVKGGTFREDLFYRLNVFSIHVPALRERAEDIPLLVRSFVQEFAQRMGRKIGPITRESVQLLQSYSWPGNIRQLRNVIEQAVILSDGGHLNLQMPETVDAIASATLKEAEYQHILSVLEKTHWRIKGPDGAAHQLGMHPSTLYSAMRRLNIPTNTEKDDMSS
ncbi:MAG TPA: sigma 54-interacting transcriptional regulator [Terriglobales bacterium]